MAATNATQHIEHAHQVGASVKQQLKRKRMSVALLSRKLGRHHSTVTRFINGGSLQTYILWELCLALGYNFFADLALQLDAASARPLERNTAIDTTHLQLQEEIAQLRTERDYLRRAIDLLSQK